MKGLLPEQVKDAKAQIILGNTYHLGTRPVCYAFYCLTIAKKKLLN